ncbi:hypothetical protein TARUN_6094 [Trichoderma arundinaceum]|uniref:Uncharacterized protein n=1 Tax=Trichoderma arundinaceum TaxID=490622 RepID=A0A395NJ68_TRIAR|nr:hypothetical protein TARUN_6094 [Trichoderma arundinaceum]
MSDIRDMGIKLTEEVYQRLEEERGESSREGALQRRMEQWRMDRKKKTDTMREPVVHCHDGLRQEEEEVGEADNLFVSLALSSSMSDHETDWYAARCHKAEEESSSPPEEFRWQGRKKVEKGKGICRETLLVRNCRALLSTEPRQIVAELTKALASLNAREQQPRSEEASKGEGPRQQEPHQREPEEDWVLVAEDVDVWDISDEVGAMT